MRQSIVVILLAMSVLPATGCGIFRATEQWKCDNLGLCWFGIQPSHSMAYPYEGGFPSASHSGNAKLHPPEVQNGEGARIANPSASQKSWPR